MVFGRLFGDIFGRIFNGNSLKNRCRFWHLFHRFFVDFLKVFLMNAESPDPRSIRKFSNKSQVAAFTSHTKFYWKILKKALKNHSGIDEKSMKKCIDFLIDFLIDF